MNDIKSVAMLVARDASCYSWRSPDFLSEPKDKRWQVKWPWVRFWVHARNHVESGPEKWRVKLMNINDGHPSF